MRHFFKLALFLSVISAGTYLYVMLWYVPAQVESRLTASLSQLGFGNASIGSIESDFGKITLKDISLDEKNFGKIGFLEATYTTFGYLLNDGLVERILIKDIKLTGELSENFEPTIAGWKNSSLLLETLKKLPVKIMYFENASVSLLSSTLGGLQINMEGQITRKSVSNLEFLGRVKSRQKKITFTSKVSGNLSPTGNLELVTETTELQLALDDLRINRATSEASLILFPDQSMSLTVQAIAGSMNWKNIPFQDVNITLVKEESEPTLFIEGRTSGKGSIDFIANRKWSDSEGSQFEVMVSPKTLDDFRSYLEENNLLDDKSNLPQAFLSLDTPVINVFFNKFVSLRDDLSGTFTIESAKRGLSLEGSFLKGSGRSVVNGAFLSSLDTINHIVDPKVSGASSAISGQFSWNFGEDTPKLDWKASISSELARHRYGPLLFQDIEGNIELSSKKKQSNKSDGTFTFKVPINRKIRQSGTIQIDLDAPEQRIIKKMVLSIYDGSVSAEGLFFRDNGLLPQYIVLLVSDVTLNQFFIDAGLRNFEMFGRMGGRVPLVLEDNSLNIEKGILQSQEPGVVTLSEDISEGLFPGDDEQMRTIRQALKNYHYEFFEVRLDGSVTDGIMMTLTARGKNPDIGVEPVDLNLQIETDLSLLFNNLVRQ